MTKILNVVFAIYSVLSIAAVFLMVFVFDFDHELETMMALVVGTLLIRVFIVCSASSKKK